MSGKGGGTGPGPRDAFPPTSRLPTPSSASSTNPLSTPSDSCLRRVVRVVNPNGLHLRVADRFARTANQFASRITVWNGDTRADGKSVWDLVLLVVPTDTEVILEVDGPDAHAALEPLIAVLAATGGEDYTI